MTAKTFLLIRRFGAPLSVFWAQWVTALLLLLVVCFKFTPNTCTSAPRTTSDVHGAVEGRFLEHVAGCARALLAGNRAPSHYPHGMAVPRVALCRLGLEPEPAKSTRLRATTSPLVAAAEWSWRRPACLQGEAFCLLTMVDSSTPRRADTIICWGGGRSVF